MSDKPTDLDWAAARGEKWLTQPMTRAFDARPAVR